MKKWPLVIVEWDDTSTNTGWDEEREDYTKEALSCISVGWKLKSTRKHIVITPMRTVEGRCNDRQIIPRGCIKSIKRID
jgi:hypothetical protein